MPLYEIMCITTLQSTPQQLVNTLQRLAVVVQKGKGVFRRVEHLGVRPLATRMKAHMKYNTVGRYVRLYIQASPLLCRDVETRLRVDDNIVRTLTIKHGQPAPISVAKRVHNVKTVNQTSATGILTHSPNVDYHAAKVLMQLGYLSGEEVLSLPRYKPDAKWDAIRTNELIARSSAGSAEATAALQIPIPTRKQELRIMYQEGKEEESAMQAYEEFRLQTNQRKLQDAKDYEKKEDEKQAARQEWYQRSGQARRDWKVAKKRLGGKKPKDAAHFQKVINTPLPTYLSKKRNLARYIRNGKIVPPPAWAVKDAQQQQQQEKQA